MGQDKDPVSFPDLILGYLGKYNRFATAGGKNQKRLLDTVLPLSLNGFPGFLLIWSKLHN